MRTPSSCGRARRCITKPRSCTCCSGTTVRSSSTRGRRLTRGLFPLRGTVDELLERWLLKHPRQTYELVVAHTHAHGDHVAGDVQFADRPLTTIVPAALDGLRDYFAFTDWPGGIVAFDLGGRRLELIGCPGHHETSIAIFDPWTGFLLTGDTVYRGRLFVSDMAAYAATVDRLVSFADDRRATHLMGGHIEMTRRPGRDYPMGAVYQPDEPPLQMSPTQLGDLRDAVASSRRSPRRPLLRRLHRGQSAWDRDGLAPGCALDGPSPRSRAPRAPTSRPVVRSERFRRRRPAQSGYAGRLGPTCDAVRIVMGRRASDRRSHSK